MISREAAASRTPVRVSETQVVTVCAANDVGRFGCQRAHTRVREAAAAAAAAAAAPHKPMSALQNVLVYGVHVQIVNDQCWHAVRLHQGTAFLARRQAIELGCRRALICAIRCDRQHGAKFAAPAFAAAAFAAIFNKRANRPRG